MRIRYLLVFAIAFALIGSPAFAKSSYDGGNGVLIPTVKANGKGGFTAAVLKIWHNGKHSVIKGKDFDSPEKAARQAHREAKALEKRVKKADSNKEKFNLFKAIAKLFKKKKSGDGVMLGPDGRADFGEIGTWGEFVLISTGETYSMDEELWK